MVKMLEPIAIVGTGCRLPGGVNNTNDLWDLLMEGKSGYSEMPKDRMNIDAWYHPEGVRPGSIVSKGGFFCQHDLHEFDNSFFGITAVEASTMDPAQKQLLEVAYEAFESASVSLEELKGSNTGVYVGNFGLDEALKVMKDSEYLSTYTSTGTGGTILSNRISYVFDLKGPSFTLDTACSSSLYALHLACAGLRNGDCSSALVCAPNAIRSAEAHLMSSRLGAISKTSRCHTFDEQADGYARADGFCATYIMRLSTALERKLPIRAVIRGTAIGANGTGVGLTHPDSKGQAAVIRKCYANAGLSDLSQTGYFECHGTGTPVGDPIETNAVSSVFAASRTRQDPLLIGSVKTNLGHSEAAAGLTALLKVSLAIEKGVIPATIDVTKVNPAIKLDEWKLKIVTQPTSWPANIPIRRASVNSFGYGGANAHIILESVASVLDEFKLTLRNSLPASSRPFNASPTLTDDGFDEERGSGRSTPPTSDAGSTIMDRLLHKDLPKMIVCSARNETSLRLTIQAVQDALKRPAAAEDVAFTLARRSKFNHRAVAIISNGQEPVFVTGEVPKGATKLGFIFTGQGAQWPQMGNDLLAIPEFRAAVRKIDEALATLPLAPTWTVEEMMMAHLSTDEMDEPGVAQLLSIAVELALVDLLAKWNIVPELVGGHSAGEIAAAYCAGYLTRLEAVAVAYYRGHAVSKTSQPPGAMLAVGVSAEAAEKLLPADGTVVVGAINSPRSVTLSGDADSIHAIQQDLEARKVFNRLLATKGRSYHSPYMESAAEAYSQPLQSLAQDRPTPEVRAEFFSTVTGSRWSDKEIPMSYWRRNMESPVLFYQAVAEMRQAGMTHVVEIGPHSTLRSPILDIIKSLHSTNSLSFQYLGAMKRKDDCIRTVLDVAAQLNLGGFDVDVDRVNGDRGALILDFPGYTWDHSSKYVSENRADREWRFRKHPRHDLLGSKTPGSALSVTIWRNVLSLTTVPWMRDHKVGEHYIFPAAGFMSMAVEALRQTLSEENGHPTREAGVFILEDIDIGAAMMVDEEIEIFFTLKKQHLGGTTVSSQWWEFNISSVKETLSTEHAKGRISWAPESEQHLYPVLPPSTLPFRERVPASYWYEDLTKTKGLIFGKSFQRISDVDLDLHEHRARAAVNLSTDPELTSMAYESNYVVHPTILDNCLQLSVLAAGKGDSHQAYVPVSVNRLTIVEHVPQHGVSMDRRSARLDASGQHVGFKGLYGNVELCDPDSGQMMISLEGLRLVGVPAALDPALREPFWRLGWDDDYNAITKKSEDVYFPQEQYWPKQYNYSRKRRVYFVQMAVRQFSQRYPELLTSEPVNVENKHFITWVNWLLPETERDHPEMYHMTLEEREAEIEKERPLAPPGTEWTWALYDNLHRIIRGEISVLDIATDNELLGKFYATQLIYDKFTRAVEILGYKQPNMRILEIGAGTGSATEFILNALTTGGTKRYSQFVYTDISTSFFIHASERFSQFEDIEYRVYDMDRDPEEQGYEAGSFDLVIASCTVHVTANITHALQSIRKLLKVGGKLLLSEITTEWHDQTFSMGMLPGFYKGYDEGRTRHPFWTPEQWTEAFPKAHFQTELSVNDIPQDHGFTVLCASAVPIPSPDSVMPQIPQRESGITLVHLGNPGSIAEHLTSLAWAEGLAVHQRSLVQLGYQTTGDWIGSKRIIVLAELERYIWPTITEAEWIEFQKMMQAAESILWVTQGGLMAGEDPQAALINGFFQCLDINPNIRAASMDFEKNTPQDRDMAWDILHRERMLPTEADKQFRQHQGKWVIPRLVPDQRLNNDFNLVHHLDQQPSETPMKDVGPVRIGTTDAGRLSALVFRPDHEILSSSLNDHEVQVDIRAVGMNMVELSALTGGYDTSDMSSEFSGFITHVGSGVENLCVGDRVFGLYGGKFGNVLRLPALACRKARGDESFEQLATLPSAYCTALYAIETVGRLQSGQTVLIQSATGGFGTAAIAVARLHQADIYVTAGSEAKRQLLQDMGIPTNRIFDSRDTGAYRKLKVATGGRGFDVVLNTSSGDYFRSVSLRLVAPMGRFIELKKNDILDKGSINLKHFNEGATLIPVDMHYICHHQPEVLFRLMKAVGELYHAGQIDPLPVISYPISQISQAYTEFSRFQHTGKLVLSYDPDHQIPYLHEPTPVRFDPNAAYLIVGGLRGIGSNLSKWMVRQGAKHLVFLARSPTVNGPEDVQETISHLTEMGAVVHTVQGSVCDQHDVERAFTISGLPIRGVINSALVLRNMEFARLTAEDVHDTFRPKLEGNENLYAMSEKLGLSLDFFIMLSSLTSIAHAATQASYSAANCFMDEYARHLRRRGVRATSIPLGVIGDTGFMSRHQHNMMHLMRNGHYVTFGSELMEQLAVALFRPEPVDAWGVENPVALGTEPAKLRQLVDSGNVPEPIWDRDARWGVIGVHAMSQGSRGGAGLGGGASATKAKDLVIERLAKLLWLPVEKLKADTSLAALGIDSMIASEFRHWMYQTFNRNIGIMDLLAADMTPEKLAMMLEE